MRQFEKWMPVAAIALVACMLLAVGVAGRKRVTVFDENRKVTVSMVGTDMKRALKAAGVELGAFDEVIPDLGQRLVEGMEIRVLRARAHEIFVDGQVVPVSTTKRQVSEIIDAAGVSLGQSDLVHPGRHAMLNEAGTIEIVRVTEEIVETEVDMPYSTLIEISDDLESGQTEIVQSGESGIKRITYRIVYEDGEEIRRELLEETVLNEPVDEVLRRGQENLYVTSRGRPLRYKKVYVMRATAYDLSFESCGKYPDHPEYGITYSGTKARPGVIAVDPRVIKLGSELYVESMDRMPDYGFAKAEDTGSAIKGNRVDLFIADRAQALRYGVRTVRVYVLEEPVTEDMMTGYSQR